MCIRDRLIGVLPAWRIYIARKIDPSKITGKSSLLKGLHHFLFRRYYINSFFYNVVAYPFIAFSNILLRYLEIGGIDRFNYVLVDGFRGFCSWFRRSHTGSLNYNIALMILGLLLILLFLGVTIIG